MKFSIRGLIKVGLLLAACNAAFAQQIIEFNSVKAETGFRPIYNGKALYDDRISAEFTRPSGVVGKVPVMVIMHSSGGISEISTGAWEKFFLDRGIATFVVDSFKLRGIRETSTDQSQLSEVATTVDGLMALQAVAKIPGVDPNKVGIIGFSRGGIASVNTTFTRLIKSVPVENPNLKFAAHIAFYPTCTRFGDSNGQPILLLMGDNDDNHPMFLCNNYVEKLKSKGSNLTFVVYPGARHGFDIDRKGKYVSKAQTWKSCTRNRKEDVDTLTFMIDDVPVSAKDYVAYSQSCRTFGINVGPDSFGAEDSRKQVEAFLRKHFAM